MAGFNDIRDRVKNIWMKGMDSIGSTAASIASNTRYKVDEMNLQNRRRDLAQDLSGRVYSLWQKGEAFPPEIEKLLKELQHVDETLNDMRAARAQGETPAPDAAAQAAGSETPEAPDAPETPEDGEGAARETEFMTDLEAHMQRTMEDTSSALKQEELKKEAELKRQEIARNRQKLKEQEQLEKARKDGFAVRPRLNSVQVRVRKVARRAARRAGR